MTMAMTMTIDTCLQCAVTSSSRRIAVWPFVVSWSWPRVVPARLGCLSKVDWSRLNGGLPWRSFGFSPSGSCCFIVCSRPSRRVAFWAFAVSWSWPRVAPARLGCLSKADWSRLNDCFGAASASAPRARFASLCVHVRHVVPLSRPSSRIVSQSRARWPRGRSSCLNLGRVGPVVVHRVHAVVVDVVVVCQTSVQCCVWGRCRVTSYVSNTHDPQPQHSPLMNNLRATQWPPIQLKTLEARRSLDEELRS